jgi:hypothetical protein
MAEHGMTPQGPGSPASDGRGNAAWQKALAELATVQAQERARRRRN